MKCLYTGKELDKLSDNLQRLNGRICDQCGSECIDRCLRCGAPQCCPKCCAEEHRKTNVEGKRKHITTGKVNNPAL